VPAYVARKTRSAGGPGPRSAVGRRSASGRLRRRRLPAPV